MIKKLKSYKTDLLRPGKITSKETIKMKCSICKEEGHRSNNTNFHPAESTSDSEKLSQATSEVKKMSQSIKEIYAKILLLLNTEYTLPITKNKGLPGLFLEDLLGIPHTQNLLDCSDGELKLFPVKQLKNGTLVPKESMAITMLSREDLKTTEFKSSKCYKKISRVLFVPYYRTSDTIKFMTPKIIDKDCADCLEIYKIFESDYNKIRDKYLENGSLKSSIGSLLQNRTKGAGHGSTSRAFYLRPTFMKHYIPLSS